MKFLNSTNPILLAKWIIDNAHYLENEEKLKLKGQYEKFRESVKRAKEALGIIVETNK